MRATHKRIALKTEIEATRNLKSRDRFTVCIEIVMSKSIEANKAISADDAKDIYLQAKKF